MGGVGNYEHILKAVKNKRCDAVSTANLFNFLGTGLEESRKKSIKHKINLANFSSKIILNTI